MNITKEICKSIYYSLIAPFLVLYLVFYIKYYKTLIDNKEFILATVFLICCSLLILYILNFIYLIYIILKKKSIINETPNKGSESTKKVDLNKVLSVNYVT